MITLREMLKSLYRGNLDFSYSTFEKACMIELGFDEEQSKWLYLKLRVNSETGEDHSDDERCEFLDKLDKSPIEVSQWEAEFIDSTKTRRDFTPNQRDAIDRMIRKYRSRINF